MSVADRVFNDPFASVDLSIGLAAASGDQRELARLYGVRAGIAGRLGQDPWPDLRRAGAEAVAVRGPLGEQDTIVVALAAIGAPDAALELLPRLDGEWEHAEDTSSPELAHTRRLTWSALTKLSLDQPSVDDARRWLDDHQAEIESDVDRLRHSEIRLDLRPELHLPIVALLHITIARAGGIEPDPLDWSRSSEG